VRDLALVAAMLFYLPVSLRFPAAGALCWAWFSIMNPHRQLYGFAYGQQFNSVVAVATLVGWLVSREPKRWTPDAVPRLLLLLTAWMTLNTALGAFPGYSWVFWDRVMRILALIFLTFFLITTKARIHAMIWIIVISLGFYGVKGGVFTITNGGHAIVYGPADSVYADNNQLALAVVTEIPLLFYLWRYTRAVWLRLPILVAMALQVLMVFGSYSRGGVIALATMLAMLWLRSDRKVLYGVLAALLVGIGLSLMPPAFFDRMHTVNSLDTDDSFQGRVNAWHVAFLYATEHFPFGAGFYAPQLNSIFNHYLPDEVPHAAHSIYFQMLGEQGFGGLAIYLAILLFALRNAGIVLRQTRDRPGLRWAYDLADMCRVALIAFYVGGAALSMAYADEYLLIIALLSLLRQLTQPQASAAKAPAPWRRAMSRPPDAEAMTPPAAEAMTLTAAARYDSDWPAPIRPAPGSTAPGSTTPGSTAPEPTNRSA
jgi:probable O-glycosylation ligase (exosortase A-associated)